MTFWQVVDFIYFASFVGWHLELSRAKLIQTGESGMVRYRISFHFIMQTEECECGKVADLLKFFLS